MLENFMTLIIGLTGGLAAGFQSPLVGGMGQRLGGASSSFIVHLSGAFFSGLLLLWRGGEKIRDWQSLPWYMLISGLFGLVIVQTISITLPRLGAAMMITLVIVGQLLVGVVIDHFGWFGVAVRSIEPARLLGVIVLLTGVYLIAK